MINNVSFKGNIYKAPNFDKTISRADRETIQEYADKFDVDVHVIDKQNYVDGKGKYTTAIIGENGKAYIKIFNIRYPELSHLYKKDPQSALYDTELDEDNFIEENEEIFK